MIIKIPIGNLSRAEAEKHLAELISSYKEEIDIRNEIRKEKIKNIFGQKSQNIIR